jgi:hypothetical protein
MCLVIDVNVLCLVFGKKKRAAFTPVREWIENGRGRMIYGGTKYNQELANWKMLPMLKELNTARRTVHIPNATVDEIARALKIKFPEADFDDEHIAALVIASRCRVVCTNDKRAMPYLKCRELFAGYDGVERPKIFTGDRRHGKMCCDDHIVAVCRA